MVGIRAAQTDESASAGTVVVVEDRAIVRAGLVAALRAQGHDAVGVSTTAEICFDSCQQGAFVVDGARGAAMISELAEHVAVRKLDARILVIDHAPGKHRTDAGVEVVERSLGAAGIMRALSDSAPSPDPVGGRVEQPTHTLSGVERAVLRLIAHGATAGQAAAALGISHRTVENHKRRIFVVLGATSQAQAVALAIRAGELTPMVYAS